MGKIPLQLQPDYKKLTASTLRNRQPVSAFLTCPYFSSPFVHGMLFLDSFALKSPQEKETGFKHLLTTLPALPKACILGFILPALRTAIVDLGCTHPLALATTLAALRIVGGDDSAVSRLVQPMIVKMFGANERGIRICLLQALPEYVQVFFSFSSVCLGFFYFIFHSSCSH
jgi:hypothetical protein